MAHGHQHGAQQQGPFPLPGVNNIIAVGSGKGGVGKTTIAVNLAVALAKMGYKTGLLDADVYGPNVPLMMHTSQQPRVLNENLIEPLQNYGVKIISVGFLNPGDKPIVWRGPMLHQIIRQFLQQVVWGELDYLVVDLPPGTGDVQLSLAQKVPVAGAVMVCTPQNVALMDVKRGIDMFQRVGIRLLGMVENMAYMLNPVNGEKIQMFPKGELETYMKEKGIPKIGEVPFNPSVGLASEAGVPIVESHKTGAEAQEFLRIADHIRELLPV